LFASPACRSCAALCLVSSTTSSCIHCNSELCCFVLAVLCCLQATAAPCLLQKLTSVSVCVVPLFSESTEDTSLSSAPLLSTQHRHFVTVSNARCLDAQTRIMHSHQARGNRAR
jgi:hypothetical protein